MSKNLPRLSASLILLSPLEQASEDGFEYKVCLLKRGSRISNANATVFPGGNIDPIDYYATQTPPQEHDARCSFEDLPLNALKYCAIRETFEEVGILLAKPSVDKVVSMTDQQYKKWRQDLSQKSDIFPDLYAHISRISGEQHAPPLAHLFTFSRWITPETQSKRFDTTFFLHILPFKAIGSEHPLLHADGNETASAEWMTPKEALDACLQRRQILLFPPQVYLLAELAQRQSLLDVRDTLKNRKLLTILPRAKAVGPEKKDLAFLYPGDVEYADSKEEKQMPGDRRHRTYAEAVYKEGKAVKPKQPLHVKGLVRSGIEGLADLSIGNTAAECRIYRASRL